MPFDVASVRGQFPALGDGWIHFDAQAGWQVPDAVASATNAAVRALPVGPRGVYPQAAAAADAARNARRAIADVFDADPDGVVFGANRSALVTALTDALPMSSWVGDVVVARQDDEDNIVPWLRAARRFGAKVLWAETDVDGSLPTDQYADLVTRKTRVVAVTLASSTIGAITDVSQIANFARKSDSLLVCDASSAAPYVPIRLAELGADVVLVSPHRWGGPRCAAMVFADPKRIDQLARVSMDPHSTGPSRLEAEPLAGSTLAGVSASVEHLANSDATAVGKRRHRLATSMNSSFEYLQRLTTYAVNSLMQLNRVQVIGPDLHRVPAISFVVSGVPAETVCRRLADNGISALADLPSRALAQIGVAEAGGAVTVGLGPYAAPYEVDQLVRVIGSFG